MPRVDPNAAIPALRDNAASVNHQPLTTLKKAFMGIEYRCQESNEGSVKVYNRAITKGRFFFQGRLQSGQLLHKILHDYKTPVSTEYFNKHLTNSC